MMMRWLSCRASPEVGQIIAGWPERNRHDFANKNAAADRKIADTGRKD